MKSCARCGRIPRRGYDKVMVKALINLLGVYPVGTCVILDTFEVAVVAQANPDTAFLNRPLLKVVINKDGGVVPSARRRRSTSPNATPLAPSSGRSSR